NDLEYQDHWHVDLRRQRRRSHHDCELHRQTHSNGEREAHDPRKVVGLHWTYVAVFRLNHCRYHIDRTLYAEQHLTVSHDLHTCTGGDRLLAVPRVCRHDVREKGHGDVGVYR